MVLGVPTPTSPIAHRYSQWPIGLLHGPVETSAGIWVSYNSETLGTIFRHHRINDTVRPSRRSARGVVSLRRLGVRPKQPHVNLTLSDSQNDQTAALVARFCVRTIVYAGPMAKRVSTVGIRMLRHYSCQEPTDAHGMSEQTVRSWRGIGLVELARCAYCNCDAGTRRNPDAPSRPQHRFLRPACISDDVATGTVAANAL